MSGQLANDIQELSLSYNTMQERSKSIPVNTLPTGIREGIIIARKSFNGLPNFKEVERSHQDNGYVFILQEAGKTQIEIDFEIH